MERARSGERWAVRARGLLFAVLVLVWTVPSRGAEDGTGTEEERALPSWGGIPERAGGGFPYGCGRLGLPLMVGGDTGDPSSLAVFLDGAPLSDPQGEGFDWTTLGAGSVRWDRLSPGGWRARYRDGAMDGAIILVGKSGRLDVPESRLRFVEGPEGYKHTAAELGRDLGPGWGVHLSGEKSRGNPTPSTVRHRVDNFAASIDGQLPRRWHFRLSSRGSAIERRLPDARVPPEGLNLERTQRDLTFHAWRGALGESRFLVAVWSRTLDTDENLPAGRALVRANDRLRGAAFDGTWAIPQGHRLTAAGEVERRRSDWLGEEARVEWRGGVWLGDEVAGWGGTLRAGVRTEFHQKWGAYSVGEVGWSESREQGGLDVCLHRSFRTPTQLERRFSEIPTRPAVRTGARLEYTGVWPGLEFGVRTFAWSEDEHAVWRSVPLSSETPEERWVIDRKEVTALGAVLWTDLVRGWGGGGMALWLGRVRGPDGAELPTAPSARGAFGVEARWGLPLREMAVVGAVTGHGWSRMMLPEGGEKGAGVVVNVEGGLDLSNFRAVAGVRNLFDVPVSEGPFLPLKDRRTGSAERLWCSPRVACRGPRDLYFAMMLTLLD